MSDSLSIILPVYNEASNIQSVVSDILLKLPSTIHEFQIIIVNDGSTDGTDDMLCKLKSFYSNLQVVTNKKNYGYGFAIRTGIRHCDKDYIFIMDGDGQFRMEDFMQFWDNRDTYDFILGYRERRRDNVYRFILGKIGNILANLLIKQRIKDINCAFKLFKRDSLQSLCLISEGNTIYFEILYDLLRKTRYKFIQLPVNHYERLSGRQTGGTPRVVIRILLEATKIVFFKY